METLTLDNAAVLALRRLEAGHVAEASDICQRILAVLPTFGPALEILARIAFQSGSAEEAVSLMRRAADANPDVWGFRSNLGIILAEIGRPEEAKDALERAIALEPASVPALINLSNVNMSLGRSRDAVEGYRRALQLQPANATALHNLGNALNSFGDLDGAIAHSLALLAQQPREASANLNLGRAYKEAGRLDDAIALYRAADAATPDHRILSDLLFTLHFHPAYGPRELLAEHQKWNDRYAVPLRGLRAPHANDPAPDRPLRIGYIAYDLGDNPLGRFLLPLLSNHDPHQFHVFCYCDIRRSDNLGSEFARQSFPWRVIRNNSEDQIARMIRQDRIDILVDVSMHTHGNHLLALSQKPAPIQISYLAYCSTTGVETIDYRLSDPRLDPPGSDDSVYTEKTLRLPKTYWCYPLPPAAPEIGPTPSLSAGHITFGCLNDFAKVTPPVLDLWARLLNAVPASRLILHCKQGAHRKSVFDGFASAGVDPARIELVSHVATKTYFDGYNRIDVALDPFPWAGGTTTCDALWMGVPVVTLTGPTAVSRGGSSILTNANLPDCITPTPDAYLQSAAALAHDANRLSALRATLRNTMQLSPLMNAPQFARDAESLYRQVWREWCSRQALK
jgi:predicted O-linked N-acetylglucosamine transferase (SPINDLY family)